MKTLSQLIKSIGFSYVNDLITEQHYPRPKKVIMEGGELFKLEKYMTSQQCLDVIKEKGYRPANIYELLVYVKTNKKTLKGRGMWIVAFGSDFIDADGHRCVPRVDADSDGGFYFDLGYFESGWDDRHSLLVYPIQTTIKLFGGEEVIVDVEDYDRLSAYKWNLNTNGYACRTLVKDGKKTTVNMHSEINNTPNGYQTDHINRNKLDNRKENLRTVTWSENQLNVGLRKDNTTGLKGVTKKGNKWEVRTRKDGKRICLGTYSTKEEAEKAYTVFRDLENQTLASPSELSLLERVANLEAFAKQVREVFASIAMKV